MKKESFLEELGNRLEGINKAIFKAGKTIFLFLGTITIIDYWETIAIKAYFEKTITWENFLAIDIALQIIMIPIIIYVIHTTIRTYIAETSFEPKIKTLINLTIGTILFLMIIKVYTNIP